MHLNWLLRYKCRTIKYMMFDNNVFKKNRNEYHRIYWCFAVSFTQIWFNELLFNVQHKQKSFSYFTCGSHPSIFLRCFRNLQNYTLFCKESSMIKKSVQLKSYTVHCNQKHPNLYSPNYIKLYFQLSIPCTIIKLTFKF